jgi:hypothetical protein
VWTRRGLRRFLVLFFIDLSPRKVKIAVVPGAHNLFRRGVIALSNSKLRRQLSTLSNHQGLVNRLSPEAGHLGQDEASGASAWAAC